MDSPDQTAGLDVQGSGARPHPKAARPRPWFLTALLVGGVYAAVGILFALPTSHARGWRLAAWMVSGVPYAIHVAYERLRLRHSSLTSALHVAGAAALGALGLALGAIAHSLWTSTSRQHQLLLLIALVVWPVITGLP